jgi:hypothetical protein
MTKLLEGADVAWPDIGQPLALQGHALLHPRHERSQPLELQRRELLTRQLLEVGLEDHPSSIPSEDAIVTR